MPADRRWLCLGWSWFNGVSLCKEAIGKANVGDD